MQLHVAEDLLRNTESFNIAFGSVMYMNGTLERDNISTYIMYMSNLSLYCILHNIVFDAQNLELSTGYIMFGFNNTHITIPINTLRNITGIYT